MSDHSADVMPAWGTCGQAFGIALVVGTILSLVNQGAVIVGGDANPGNVGASLGERPRPLLRLERGVPGGHQIP